MQPSLHGFRWFVIFLKLHHVVNPVFVGATAESVAGLYARALKKGFHVVTPNKKANTRELAVQLRRNATSQHKFYTETNGKAENTSYWICRIVAAGERYFEGILSNTAFIFGKLKDFLFQKWPHLREKRALQRPDPRDDFIGQDVARKLLILAREAGLEHRWKWKACYRRLLWGKSADNLWRCCLIDAGIFGTSWARSRRKESIAS